MLRRWSRAAAGGRAALLWSALLLAGWGCDVTSRSQLFLDGGASGDAASAPVATPDAATSVQPLMLAPICERLIVRLTECGLLTPGTHPCREPDEVAPHCIYQCMVGGSCSDLVIAVCAELVPGVDLGTYSGDFLDCLEACATAEFSCADTQTIPHAFRCDEIPDCEDGSDEVGCPARYVECGDGQRVHTIWSCDGLPDCADGKDEADCPMFSCDDGAAIPTYLHCNGRMDCQDGSDEVGCSQSLCDSLAE
ncbi:MAG: LDL receptor domain-containing protein [Myxococcales bacterium]|nr:LDL receptor domain-containing protein [Myxococcales bacterium]